MTNYIVSGLTLVIAGFLTYVRYKDYKKHQVVLMDVSNRDKLVELVKLKGAKMAFYLFIGGTVLFIAMAFFYPDVIQGISYVLVFALMSLSEWLNVKTVETVSVFEKAVVYSNFDIRIKSIRSITSSGKRNSVVAMMDGKSFTIPQSVGEILNRLQKARKVK
jgi:hypothetical protein